MGRRGQARRAAHQHSSLKFLLVADHSKAVSRTIGVTLTRVTQEEASFSKPALRQHTIAAGLCRSGSAPCILPAPPGAALSRGLRLLAAGGVPAAPPALVQRVIRSLRIVVRIRA